MWHILRCVPSRWPIGYALWRKHSEDKDRCCCCGFRVTLPPVGLAWRFMACFTLSTQHTRRRTLIGQGSSVASLPIKTKNLWHYDCLIWHCDHHERQNNCVVLPMVGHFILAVRLMSSSQWKENWESVSLHDTSDSEWFISISSSLVVHTIYKVVLKSSDSLMPPVKVFLRNLTPTMTTVYIVLLNHQCAGGAARCHDTQ